MPSNDPFYLVKDDIQASVSSLCRPLSSIVFSMSIYSKHFSCKQQTACAARLLNHGKMQLDKAQTKYLQWQNAGKGGPERKRLQGEVDEECRSISWQVTAVLWCAVDAQFIVGTCSNS